MGVQVISSLTVQSHTQCCGRLLSYRKGYICREKLTLEITLWYHLLFIHSFQKERETSISSILSSNYQDNLQCCFQNFNQNFTHPLYKNKLYLSNLFSVQLHGNFSESFHQFSMSPGFHVNRNIICQAVVCTCFLCLSHLKEERKIGINNKVNKDI